MKNIFFVSVIFFVIPGLTGCQVFVPADPHPLIDKIWSVEDQKFISEESFGRRVQENDAIMLGETHDNLRHHQLQAQVINELVKTQRRPAVAFEMLNQEQQAVIVQFQASAKNKTDDFSQAVNWDKSGWPEWSYYRPVFQSAIENDLPIIAANLDLKLIRKVIKQGSKVLAQNYQDLLTKYQYDPALKKELEQEILSAHCDMLPEKMLSPMLMGQQVRDLAMTQAVQSSLNSSTGDGIVLISGSGHSRKDYGVPYYLQQEMPELKVVSIAFMEVSEDEFKPGDYAEAWGAKKLPFDYVWFTPRAEREDQCEKMKAYMEKRRVQ